FPDFTESRVRRWWKDLNATLVEVGMAGVENDMDEPSVFGRGTVPNFLLHGNEGKPIYHEDCHNAYGLLTAKSSWEAWRDLRPEERPFVLTRSTYAGGQRYGATWTADNQSTWEHLWLSIPMCLNLALSGFSFVGVDVGGFARHATGELLVRWTQLGAFLPFFRNHCAKAMRRQEPWAFGQPYEDACRKAIELRYELLPYLYSAFFKCSQTGFPVIRPLIFDWPEIEEFQKEDREFLFGDSLLLAPVLEEKARVREVILPPGNWCDYFTGKPYSSGKAQVEVDLFSIPLFVKSGAIIPTWKVQQFIGEELPQEVILRLYPGEGVSCLYEDDGLSMAYREGKYLLTRMVQSLTGEGIEVGIEREGEENLGARAYTFRVMGLKAEPEKVEVDGKDFAPWIFEGGVLTFTVERPMRIKIALRKD
ncbi:MAG: TIM-barrel domain-containing protein, partial [bacterium]